MNIEVEGHVFLWAFDFRNTETSVTVKNYTLDNNWN